MLTKTGIRSAMTAPMRFLVPTEKLIQKLVTGRFLKWNPSGTKLIATGLGALVNHNHADIIAYYNAVVRGILCYYTFVDNRSSLKTVVRYVHMSCARTLALKYKLRSTAKVYKKFGSRLTCPQTGISLYNPDYLAPIRGFH